MKLYEVLAAEYKEIFPSSQEKIDFVEKFLEKEKSQRILDIGCASGEFVYQLSSQKRDITGIDLDTPMIIEAKKQMPYDHTGVIHFYQADMLRFFNKSESGFYDLITCLGNTIVYLNGESELKKFLQSAHKVLKEKGKMIIQILNYSNPVIAPGFTFPRIETNRIEFNREYVAIEGTAKLGFKTSVKEIDTENIITDIHRHHPFLSRKIEEIAPAIGFTNIQIFGNYDGKVAEDSDLFHLIVLER